MKELLKLLSKASLALSLCGFIGLGACSHSAKNESSEMLGTKSSIERADSGLPNYRYVDLDTVLSKYNLAKDYTEEMLRMQQNRENEVKRYENNIQSHATTMQNKMQNNGYLTEASYKADQDQLNKMQADAQRAVANLQSNFESAALTSNKAVTDSIETFIRQYNLSKGYDAIFFKGATLYIDPRLDITDEVVEGLNARYNKVK